MIKTSELHNTENAMRQELWVNPSQEHPNPEKLIAKCCSIWTPEFPWLHFNTLKDHSNEALGCTKQTLLRKETSNNSSQPPPMWRIPFYADFNISAPPFPPLHWAECPLPLQWYSTSSWHLQWSFSHGTCDNLQRWYRPLGHSTRWEFLQSAGLLFGGYILRLEASNQPEKKMKKPPTIMISGHLAAVFLLKKSPLETHWIWSVPGKLAWIFSKIPQRLKVCHTTNEWQRYTSDLVPGSIADTAFLFGAFRFCCGGPEKNPGVFHMSGPHLISNSIHI